MYYCSINKASWKLHYLRYKNTYVPGNATVCALGVTPSFSTRWCENLPLLPAPQSSLLFVSCPAHHLFGLRLHVGTEYEIWNDANTASTVSGDLHYTLHTGLAAHQHQSPLPHAPIPTLLHAPTFWPKIRLPWVTRLVRLSKYPNNDTLTSWCREWTYLERGCSWRSGRGSQARLKGKSVGMYGVHVYTQLNEQTKSRSVLQLHDNACEFTDKAVSTTQCVFRFYSVTYVL